MEIKYKILKEDIKDIITALDKNWKIALIILIWIGIFEFISWINDYSAFEKYQLFGLMVILTLFIIFLKWRYIKI